MADPGWYEDPTDNSILRWWDGTQWTSEVAPNAPTSTPAPQGVFDPQQGQFPQQAQQAAPWEQQSGDPYGTQQSQWAGQETSGGFSPPSWPRQDNTPAATPGDYSSYTGGYEPGFANPGFGGDVQTGGQFGGGQAPWETAPTYGAANPTDPYAPQPPAQDSPWGATAPAADTNYNPLSGYAPEGDSATFGGSLYEYPDDDDTSSSTLPSFLQGPKRFIVIGGAVLLVLVLFMGVRSVLFGGGETATPDNGGQATETTDGGGGVAPPEQTSESGIPLVQIPAWSKWPSITLGYVIEYPKAPTLSSSSDRQVFTVQQDGAQYQLTVRNIDSQAVAALSGQERIELARRLIIEQNPDTTAEQVQNFTETDLGGLPARQVEWEKADGTKVVARFTFTQNRIYLLTGIGPDTERFFESFGWFREPPTL